MKRTGSSVITFVRGLHERRHPMGVEAIDVSAGGQERGERVAILNGGHQTRFGFRQRFVLGNGWGFGVVRRWNILVDAIVFGIHHDHDFHKSLYIRTSRRSDLKLYDLVFSDSYSKRSKKTS